MPRSCYAARSHLIVNVAVSILVDLTNQVVDVADRDGLADVHHDPPHLLRVNVAVAREVKDGEGGLDVRLRLDVGHLVRHQRHKFIKIDAAAAVRVRNPNHLVQLVVRRDLADRGHQRAELGGIDGSAAVLVERREGLAELVQLCLCACVRADW